MTAGAAAHGGPGGEPASRSRGGDPGTEPRSRRSVAALRRACRRVRRTPGSRRRPGDGRRLAGLAAGTAARSRAGAAPTADWRRTAVLPRAVAGDARLRGGPAACARGIGPRLAIGAIVGLARSLPAGAAAAVAGRVQLHLLRAAGRRPPPQPVHPQPDDVPSDAVYGVRRLEGRSSAYGPLFTIADATARQARRARPRSGR